MTTNSPATKYDSGCLEAIGIYKPGSNFLGSASPAHKEAKGPFAAAVEYAPRPELEDPGCLEQIGFRFPESIPREPSQTLSRMESFTVAGHAAPEDPGCLVGLGVFLPKEDAPATRTAASRDPALALA
jgi:hypothetical protein